MDLHTLWNVILTAGVGAGGWVLKSIYSAIRALETDLSQHKVEVARDYVTNTDLKEIKDALIRIENAVHAVHTARNQ